MLTFNIKSRNNLNYYNHWFNVLNFYLKEIYLYLVCKKYSFSLNLYLSYINPLKTKRHLINFNKVNVFDKVNISTKNLSNSIDYPTPISTSLIPWKGSNIIQLYFSLFNVSSDTTLRINAFHKTSFIFEVGKNYPPYLNISKFIVK